MSIELKIKKALDGYFDDSTGYADEVASAVMEKIRPELDGIANLNRIEELERKVGTLIEENRVLRANVADHIEANEDRKRLVRELDVLLNGEGVAAVQASLCDIVAELSVVSQDLGGPLMHYRVPIENRGFQDRVRTWVIDCFGAEIADDKVERNHRFLEEALELVQALGCTAEEANKLVDYVYGREVGEPGQEVGGVMVTLAALCSANNIRLEDEGNKEIKRISAFEVKHRIREKQKAKPSMSPLPGVYPDPVAAAQADPAPDDLVVSEYYSKEGAHRVHKPRDGISVLHKPTGIVVRCHSERSQYANRAKAIEDLKALLSKRKEPIRFLDQIPPIDPEYSKEYWSPVAEDQLAVGIDSEGGSHD